MKLLSAPATKPGNWDLFAEMELMSLAWMSTEKINGLLEGISRFMSQVEEMVLRNAREADCIFTTDLASCLDNVDMYA